MDKKLRIAVLLDWEIKDDASQMATLKDGMMAAIKVLKDRGHEIRFGVMGKEDGRIAHPYFPINVYSGWSTLVFNLDEFKPDVIIHWADLTRPNAKVGEFLGVKQVLCFTGGSTQGHHQYFQHVFVESKTWYDKFKDQGKPVSYAFGTNTKLFDPERMMLRYQQKTIDVLFPATFAQWKRHRLLAKALKDKGLNVVVAGYMYDDHEMDCWEDCQRAGFLVLPHLSADALAHFYQASKTVVVTSDASGGSQRTVLEAMSMNIPVIVMKDSDKCAEYLQDAETQGYWRPGSVIEPTPEAVHSAVKGWMGGEVQSRDYIKSKWTEEHYADSLLAGINSIL